jgi:hypothetical protein
MSYWAIATGICLGCAFALGRHALQAIKRGFKAELAQAQAELLVAQQHMTIAGQVEAMVVMADMLEGVINGMRRHGMRLHPMQESAVMDMVKTVRGMHRHLDEGGKIPVVDTMPGDDKSWKFSKDGKLSLGGKE